MEIKINIPDDIWEEVKDQRLTFVAGIKTLLATNVPWENFWKVKTTLCNNCGECCLDMGENWLFPPDDEGKCSKLVRENDSWVCSADYDTPVRCMPDPLKENAPSCCITYENQPFENR